MTTRRERQFHSMAVALMDVVSIAPRNLFHSFAKRLGDRMRLTRLAMRVKTERMTLSDLSDDQLKDIGLHRGDASLESRRGFYDLPPSRRAQIGQLDSSGLR